MAGTTLCPSARVLIKAINEARPDISEDLAALAKAHSDFVGMVRKLSPFSISQEADLARTNANQALAWALKGIGDQVMTDAP